MFPLFALRAIKESSIFCKISVVSTTASQPQQKKQTLCDGREDERIGTNLRTPTCGRSRWCGGTWGALAHGRSPPSPAHLRPQTTPSATEPAPEFGAGSKNRGVEPWYSRVGAAGASTVPAFQKLRQSRARPPLPLEPPAITAGIED